MSFRGKLWILVISGVIASYAVIGGLPFVGNLLTTSAQQPANDATAQMRIVESVLQHIQNDYVDDPNMEKVRLGALRGLASGLDPYSSFLTPEQVRAFETAKSSNKVGIGAEFSQLQGYLYVISVIKGSPAEKAGLKSGDVIEYIDSKATRDISLYDARQLVSGDAGSSVNLRVLRAGVKPLTLKVARGAVKAPGAESRIESGRVGVIKVYGLEDGESENIKNQIANLKKQGIAKIVLDLRGVAGGKLSEGVAVSNLFINNGDLAKVIGREGKVLSSFAADPAKAVFEGKLIVLTDLSTAGAAEAVAAAVIDRKRGDVVGERTFGAGTEQKLFPLSSGGGYLLTVAKWASPAGVAFLGEEKNTLGVKPTVEVKRPETPEPLAVQNLIDGQDEDAAAPDNAPAKPAQEKAPEDIQLKKAVEMLQDGKAATAKAEA
jgi:carboxyl-terminal processing protease